MLEAMQGTIVSVSRSPQHTFSKARAGAITLVAGLGVEGDAHAGERVKHRYLVKIDPTAKNLAQVHLIGQELFPELAGQGILVAAGEMGENVTTAGIDLLTLPLGTRLHLGATAVVEVTGLRTPCQQMNGLRPGLMKACMGKGPDGLVLRKAGIMGLAVVGGIVHPGDALRAELPPKPWTALGPV